MVSIDAATGTPALGGRVKRINATVRLDLWRRGARGLLLAWVTEAACLFRLACASTLRPLSSHTMAQRVGPGRLPGEWLHRAQLGPHARQHGVPPHGVAHVVCHILDFQATGSTTEANACAAAQVALLVPCGGPPANTGGEVGTVRMDYLDNSLKSVYDWLMRFVIGALLLWCALSIPAALMLGLFSAGCAAPDVPTPDDNPPDVAGTRVRSSPAARGGR